MMQGWLGGDLFAGEYLHFAGFDIRGADEKGRTFVGANRVVFEP